MAGETKHDYSSQPRELEGAVDGMPSADSFSRQNAGKGEASLRRSRNFLLPPRARLFDDGIPAWQQDCSGESRAPVTPQGERAAKIKACMSNLQEAVVLDQECRHLEGTAGWIAGVKQIATLSFAKGVLRPRSAQSQFDFDRARARLLSTERMSHISVVLRDLDGWAADIVHLVRVGPANPQAILMILPSVKQDMLRLVQSVAHGVRLTGKQSRIVTLILQGRMEIEIATEFGMSLASVKSNIRAILQKFAVSRRSDLIRLFACAANVNT